MMDALTYLRKMDNSGLELIHLKEKPEEEEHSEVKFSAPRDELAKILSGCIAVVPQKDRVPVLNNFLIEAGKKGIRVSSTNQELFISTVLENASVEQTGKILVPARKLLSIVKDSQGDTVYLESSNRKIAVAVGSSSWELKKPVDAVENFPTLDFSSFEEVSTLDKSTFCSAIETVKYAARKDFSRANLRIIKIDSGRFSAYDGARFQRISTPMTDLSMEIPAFSVDLILKKLKAAPGDQVTVGQTADVLCFILGKEIFSTKKTKLEYPNVDTQVLRPVLANRHELVVSKDDLSNAIKAVRISADSEYNAIGLLIESDKVEVFTRDGENRASSVIPCTWKGKTRLVVVNHIQLKELLNAHEGNTCSFYLGDDTKMRKSTLMLKAPENEFIGFVSQLAASAVGVREIS